MMRTIPNFLRGALAVLALLLAMPALADTPIKLFKSFAGNINMTGTQKTMRTRSNGIDACATTSPVTMNLSGLPSGATILAAYLYWAGSGSKPDYTVTFNGKSITAPVTRQFESGTVGYDYFSGAADVTDQVKGNGNYTAGGLDIEKTLFCAVQGVLGGFQLLVVYSHGTETFRVLNVYEGFQYIRNSSVELTLANFQTPNPIGKLTGRVGHITWEGDTTLSGGGETLRFNGVEQTDFYNPPGNQFNSISSVNLDLYSYGIDFDVYTVRDPVIGSGQKSAKTVYTSGSDLVLLNAEVIAAPNVSATDRGVTLTLNGPLVPSAPTTYTIRVVNNGPMDEGGPLIVTGTLPAALINGGATGNGWSCTKGQTLTCTYAGLVKTNTTLPPITLTVTPADQASGLVSFGVTVGGKLFDYYDGNDTSTVSTRIGKQEFTPQFVFTDAQCVHGKSFDNPEQTCKKLKHEFIEANTDLPTFITFVANDVPTALASTNTMLPMRFALSCHNPTTTAGTKASYFLRSGTVTIPPCEPDGAIPGQMSTAWSAASNILFPANSPSSQATTARVETDRADFLLRYPDVGRVELFMTDNRARLGSSDAFVSRPNRLQLQAQAGNGAGDPASATDPRFVAAGTPFTMTVRAMMVDSATPAMNFGREDEPVKIKLLVKPAGTADGSPIAAMVTRNGDEAAAGELTIVPVGRDGKPKEPFGPFIAGVATGNEFVFDDVGVIRVEAMIQPTDEELARDDKIERGSYLGTGSIDVSRLNVGRFFPAYFDTVVVDAMACIEAAQCPKPVPDPAPARTINAMAYSKQPFKVRVTARSGKGVALSNYRMELARDVALTAFKAPNGTEAQTLPATSTLSNRSIDASAFTGGVATATPTYAFPEAIAYKTTEPNAKNWSQPVSLYLRAIESSGSDGVTSRRAEAVEGGVRIVTGRLWINSTKGSAAAARNIDIKPQLYGTVNGIASWYDVTTDSTPAAFALTDVRFSDCSKLPKASGCKLALTVDRATLGAISEGAGTVKLMAPTAGSSGIVSMWLGTAGYAGAPVWLPSVLATQEYGTVPRSPYTYLRELY